MHVLKPMDYTPSNVREMYFVCVLVRSNVKVYMSISVCPFTFMHACLEG